MRKDAQEENCGNQIEESISVINSEERSIDRHFYAQKLLSIIEDDSSYAIQILNGIRPSKIGHWQVSHLCVKLWEKCPAQYADKMQDYLISKISALSPSQRDPEYASAWLCSIIEKFPERSKKISRKITSRQLNQKACSKLRRVIDKTQDSSTNPQRSAFIVNTATKHQPYSATNE